jgi:hypothetical protein
MRNLFRKDFDMKRSSIEGALIVASSVCLAFLVSCGYSQSTSRAANVTGDELSGSAVTVWLATETEGADKAKCLALAKKLFSEVSYLEAIGVYVLTSPTISRTPLMTLKDSGCVSSFEIETEATIQKRRNPDLRPSNGSSDDVTGSAVTTWNAVLPSSGLTPECIDKAKSLRLKVVQVLENIEVATFESPNISEAPMSELKEAKCIESFELSGEVTGQ